MTIRVLVRFSFSLLIIGALLYIPPDFSKAMDIYWTEDQVIYGTQVITQDTIYLSGNLTINRTGNLTLSGTTLVISSTVDMIYHIEVQEGGTLHILANSIVLAEFWQYEYYFWVRPNATLQIDCSTMRDSDGLCIQSNLVSATNSTFSNNNHGMTISDASHPQIFNNSICDNFEGLLVNGADPSISYNNFSGNIYTGITIENSSHPSIEYNIFSNSETPRGILSSDSSPNISHNTFFSNGIRISGVGTINITDNQIENNGYFGIYIEGQPNNFYGHIARNILSQNIYGIYLGGGYCLVENNSIILPNIDGWVGISDRSNSLVQNNLISGGKYGVSLEDACRSNYVGCSINGPLFSAIGGDARTTAFTAIFTNCTLTNNTCAVQFNKTGSAGGTCYLLNTFRDNPPICITNPNTNLIVQWYVHVKTVMESSDVAASGAIVNFTSVLGGVQKQDMTSPDGWTNWIVLQEKSYRASTQGPIYTAPYNISAEKNGFLNYTQIKLEKNYEFTLPLDDIPPWVKVSRPLDGAVVNQTSINVSGTAEPGCNLTVNSIKSVIKPTGEWYAIVPLVEGPNALNVSVIDHGSNRVDLTVHVTRDTIPPGITIFSPSNNFTVNSSPILIKGFTDDKDCRLYINVKKIDIGLDGNFSASVDLLEGQNTITISGRDSALNTATIVLKGVLDTIVPDLVLTQPASLGVSTNASSIIIKGYTEAGCNVTIGGIPASLKPANDFIAEVPLIEGDNNITVVSVDQVGNSKTIYLIVRRDSTPPMVIITYPANNTAFNKPQLEMKGTLEDGASIAVDGILAHPLAGSFTATIKLIKDGGQTVVIDVWDALNNHAIIEWVIYYDTTPPLINITSPANGFITNRSSIKITGNTEKNATALIFDRPVTIDADGLFNADFTLDKEGRNDFTITITDPAGNRARMTLNITRDTEVHYNISYPRDGQKTTKKNITLIGITEPNSTITVQGNTIQVQANGSFFSEVFLTEGKNIITVTMKDAALNTGKTIITVERTKPSPQGRFLPGLEAVTLLVVFGLLFIIHKNRSWSESEGYLNKE